jgi:hypothetical protein
MWLLLSAFSTLVLRVRWRRYGFVAVVTTACLTATSAIALAYNRHIYVSGYEMNQATGYTGFEQRRNILSSIQLPNCWPIYDTTWEQTTVDDYVELATSYGCSGVVTIVGAALNGQWVEISESADGTTYGEHTFKVMLAKTDRYWSFTVDGIDQHHRVYTDGKTAYQLAVVIESYETAIIAPAHNDDQLQDRRWWSGAGLVDWAGRDALYTPYPDDTWLCIQWNSDTSLRVGENTAC